MGYVYVKIFLGTPVHLGASGFSCGSVRIAAFPVSADTPRCAPITPVRNRHTMKLRRQAYMPSR